MTIKIINGWEFNDYDDNFNMLVCGPDNKYIDVVDGIVELTHEINADNGRGGTMKDNAYCEVPLDVLAEVLRHNGYEVTKK